MFPLASNLLCEAMIFLLPRLLDDTEMQLSSVDPDSLSPEIHIIRLALDIPFLIREVKVIRVNLKSYYPDYNHGTQESG